MAEVYILTGPVHSGKTTALQRWIKGKADVCGILSPVVDEKRHFVNVATNEIFPMEATADEQALFVGKYGFSKSSFEKAKNILRKGAAQKGGWLIIDEIGPLELQDNGFADVLKEILLKSEIKLLLVVRENILESIIQHFQINSFTLLNKTDFESFPF